MSNRKLTYEEFKILFSDRFQTEEEFRSEYESFFSVFEQLDRASVPDLPSCDKVNIFEQAWQGSVASMFHRQDSRDTGVLSWFAWIRRPAVTFVSGLVIGCILTAMVMNGQIDLARTASADHPLIVEQTPYTQTYKGKIIDEIYSQIENPQIVVSKTERTDPRRVLYGTLDNGEVYFVWNL
ncbi:MAG: hypothetical protein C4527_05030 [Candidatus Omnitrophota bacterium]|jgi:hypothetical protein|nr:MAG: hypothetical protein C4527_05030 [Candidatus Omnitrophota bacterium]